MTKRVALYHRVSSNSQTVDNQRLELERVAAQRGWQIVAVYEDRAISGSKGRERRPGFDNLCCDATRGKFSLIAAFSVDRLGRSLKDLVGFLCEINTIGIDLYLHQQALDSTTASGRAMFGMAAVYAEFELAMREGEGKFWPRSCASQRQGFG
jgi:DNA invertase Pin-like site-specific DNA recombinase